MKNKNLLLLKTLLRSTSQMNSLKNCKDKKKKGKIIGNAIGMFVLYLFLMVYCVLMCIGYGIMGMADAIPMMCALAITAIAFIFTLLKTNGYLFQFKEYDMLMSLPFEIKTVATMKFFYMYIKSMPWFVSITVAMMVGYGIYARPSFIMYPIWILLSLLLPIIPMLVAALIGFFIARISSGFRKTNIVQTVLMIVFVILCFCSRFFIEAIFRNNEIADTIQQVSETTDQIGKWYVPAQWFTESVVSLRISSICLFLSVTLFLYEFCFVVMGRSYRQINSALTSHAASKSYQVTAQKKRSLVNTIAFKEFKRMTGSTTYMTNAVIGEILAFLLGTVSLFVGVDKVILTVMNNAPISAEIIYPALPLIVYFLIGMVPTTACSPSLEGKNYWIVQSLPLSKKTLYQGKMLFNLYLTVPFAVFATLCLGISARVSLLKLILYLIEIVILCAFSTTWGCVCGVKHIKLEWENEIEVVKQGSAVAIYLFPNMLITMGLIVLTVFLGTRMDSNLVVVFIMVLAAILAGFSYLRVMKLAKK